MPLFKSPQLRGVKTRAQYRREITANEEEKLEVMSEIHRKMDAVKVIEKVQSDIVSPCHRSNKNGVSAARSRSSTSSAARRQLEYKAAQARALIELEEIQLQADLAKKKAEIEKCLLEKKMAADLANLEDSSRRSKLSSVTSYRSKVENWLEKSIAAPGSSLKCFEISGDNREPRPAAGPTTSADTCNAIAELSTAIKEAVSAASSNNRNKQLLSRLATSKDLPLYFGDPLEFLQLKEAYEESTRLCKYSDQENVWRLRKCLRGEAKEAISSLLMSATSPQEIMDTLELKFGRPENIMRKVVTQLKKIPPMTQAYHTEIVNFALKVKNYVTATRNIQQRDYLRSPELVTIILAKMPTALVSLWATYFIQNQDGDTPKLEMLAQFLYTEAEKIAKSGLSYAYASDSKKPAEIVQRSAPSRPILTSIEISSEPAKCKFCKTQNHMLTQCAKFKRALRKDRWRYARVNKLCYKCLGARHTDISTCTAECCDVEECGGPHHRLLHWKRPQAAAAHQESPSHEEQSDVNVVAHAISSECSVLSVPKPVPKVLLKVVPVTIHGPKSSVATYALLDDGATVSLISADLAELAGLHGKSCTMRAASAWDSAELVCKTEIIDFSKVRRGKCADGASAPTLKISKTKHLIQLTPSYIHGIK